MLRLGGSLSVSWAQDSNPQGVPSSLCSQLCALLSLSRMDPLWHTGDIWVPRWNSSSRFGKWPPGCPHFLWWWPFCHQSLSLRGKWPWHQKPNVWERIAIIMLNFWLFIYSELMDTNSSWYFKPSKYIRILDMRSGELSLMPQPLVNFNLIFNLSIKGLWQRYILLTSFYLVALIWLSWNLFVHCFLGAKKVKLSWKWGT